MSLSEIQKRQLRKLGHTLKPVVMIGNNGLTDAVSSELERSLSHHELLKVKVKADRIERDDIIRRICNDTAAELVQRVGNIALIYRRNPETQKIHLNK